MAGTFEIFRSERITRDSYKAGRKPTSQELLRETSSSPTRTRRSKSDLRVGLFRNVRPKKPHFPITPFTLTRNTDAGAYARSRVA
jgi:hypothetical protein